MYKSFKDLPIWKEAMDIAEVVFRLSEAFPRKEDYGLTSQIRRSTVSIAANIAEAFGRGHAADKMKFYYYSRGSVTETQSHLEYAQRIGYLPADVAKGLDNRLESLHTSLNKVLATLRLSQ